MVSILLALAIWGRRSGRAGSSALGNMFGGFCGSLMDGELMCSASKHLAVGLQSYTRYISAIKDEVSFTRLLKRAAYLAREQCQAFAITYRTT